MQPSPCQAQIFCPRQSTWAWICLVRSGSLPSQLSGPLMALVLSVATACGLLGPRVSGQPQIPSLQFPAQNWITQWPAGAAWRGHGWRWVSAQGVTLASGRSEGVTSWPPTLWPLCRSGCVPLGWVWSGFASPSFLVHCLSLTLLPGSVAQTFDRGSDSKDAVLK